MALDLLDFIDNLDDERLSSYLNEEIIEQAKKWEDQHGNDIISMIRQTIVDRLIAKQAVPLTPFNTTRPNEFTEQSIESVRFGELSDIRRLYVYFVDGDVTSSHEKRIFNSIDNLKKNSLNEYLLFYHGTTEAHARSIIARGIHLRPRCSRGGDFGFGFYTTNDFCAAIRHAENRAMRTQGEQRPACLIFGIRKDEFNGHEILRLAYDQCVESVSKQ